MIEQIIRLNGIGMLHESVSKEPVALTDSVAIYAENGRGKSTLASVLRSLRSNDCTELLARRALRQEGGPHAELLIDGEKRTLADGSWDRTYEGLHVFDDDFVERNVSAGRFVWSMQLEQLLTSLLGGDSALRTEDVEDDLEDCLHGINSRLRAFRAGFELATLERVDGGDAPRADYSLRLMGATLPLVAAEPTLASFSTALSPADRRLLALACFFCILDRDADLPGKTVVFDDPARTLDRQRMTRVIEAIRGFIGRVQIVVLSHDADFLEMLRSQGVEQVLQLRRSGEYCVLEDCDLDAVRAMDYTEDLSEPEGWQSGGHLF